MQKNKLKKVGDMLARLKKNIYLCTRNSEE